MSEEIGEEMLDRQNINDKENPYEAMIINDFKMITVKVDTSQVEEWSIQSKM